MSMEKQRSFSIKRTRFFVFSLTISFSIVFFTFFSIWVFKTAPSFINLEPHLQFNDFDPSTIHGQTLQKSNPSPHLVRDSVNLNQTHFSKPLNASETAKIPPRFDGFQRKTSGIQLPNLGIAVNGTRFPDFDANSSIRNVKKSSLVDLKNKDSQNTSVSGGLALKPEVSRRENAQKRGDRLCDVTKGKWVFDESYPLYTAATCPFIDEGFNCEANGRLDKDYRKWRWKPHDCDIPRFNATNMLESIRGKRLVFVGDSINRNQWESLLCLLTSVVKDRTRVYETHGRRITKEKGNYSFKFLDYKCMVEYHVSHFLVRESKARIGRKRTQTLRIDAVDRGSSRWKGADVLIFNTAHWWSHYKTKYGINYYQEGDQVLPRLDASTAFRKSMTTWASWVDRYIDPKKTRVVFRTSSPSHFRGGEWNAGGHCKEASRPLDRTAKSIDYPEKNAIVEDVVKRMKTPIETLNVTNLSDYRVDGHPSVYGRKGGGRGGEDCSHWCLPGVPDTWNELLYYRLQLKVRNSFVV